MPGIWGWLVWPSSIINFYKGFYIKNIFDIFLKKDQIVFVSFEINRTKIKGGCQSGRKVVTHDSRSIHLL